MQELIERLKKIKERSNYSQTDLALKIGRSPAVINQFLQGKYKGDLDDVTARIGDFVETEEARFDAKFKAPSFIETASTIRAKELINFARQYRTICVLTATSGLGKSTILKECKTKYKHRTCTLMCRASLMRWWRNDIDLNFI